MLKKNLIILCSLILFLAPAVVKSQVEGILYGDKITPGSTLLIITNQEIIETDTGVFCTGKIISETQPNYLKAVFHRYDSITYQIIPAQTILDEMQAKKGNWLYFVHGAGKNFEKAVWSGFDIQHFQQVNVVVYSWPASNPDLKALQDLKNSLTTMQLSTQHFKESLLMMQTYRNMLQKTHDTTHLSLLLHSMGNMFLEQMTNRKELNGLQNNIFDNIVVNAAAVNEANHKEWMEKLNMQKRIYVISNEGDVILKGLRFMTKQSMQLGEKVLSKRAKNATYVDFDLAVGLRMPPGVSHTYFMAASAENDPRIRNFFHLIFNGYEAEFNDSKLFKLNDDGFGYHFLAPDTTKTNSTINTNEPQNPR